MKKFQLIIAYEGTTFGGWQIQTNAVSIQALIENALSTILREPITLVGSGRTDAGVHAAGQSAHFTTTANFDLSRLLLSGNALLPPEIRLLKIEPAPDDFHARYSVKNKIYHYHLHLDPTPNPFKRLYSYRLPFQLDKDLLVASAQSFIGTHDFTSFANQASVGSAAKNPVRTLHRLDVIEEEGGIRLEFQGEGFLYKMVRNITGMLIDIARGKRESAELPEIFAAKDRRRAAPAAPAHGLCLYQVNY